MKYIELSQNKQSIIDDKSDAAKAYDKAAQRYFKDFANLNFKDIKKMITEKELDYLRMAYEQASNWSNDPRTQNGAILVKDGNIIGVGVNKFPNNVKITNERLERPKKYMYMEHAERNAIYDAARYGFSVIDSTLYCPWYCCSDCARGLVQAGVKRVIGHKQVFEAYGDGAWTDSINAGNDILDEGGVIRELYDGKVGGIPILLNGISFQP